jgi:hypothetical protein
VFHVDVTGRQKSMNAGEARTLPIRPIRENRMRNGSFAKTAASEKGNVGARSADFLILTCTARAQVSMSFFVARARPQIIGGLLPVPTVSAMV